MFPGNAVTSLYQKVVYLILRDPHVLTTFNNPSLHQLREHGVKLTTLYYFLKYVFVHRH